jgi:cytidylate kinase
MDGIGEQALKAADPKAPDQRLIRTETIRRGTDPAPVQKTEENMINIAIDGPAGAGKSTIAKKVAAEKNYIYVDTGAMYRAMALYLLRSGIDREDAAAISAACGKPEITIEYRDGIQVVLLDGENVNEFLRTPRVSDMASRSSANPDVRAKLLELQKDLARRENVVMDGRDIGTVVLPDAQVKIFLTASVDVRADRRYRELIEKGEKADLDEIRAQIKERDERDMNRPISPLKQAEDAVLVDTSDMAIDEVVAAIMRIIEEKI